MTTYVAFCGEFSAWFDALVDSYKSKVFYIGEAAKQLGVTPQHLRMLEWQGRIPPARRDLNGRLYTVADIALLRGMGVGSRPRKLKRTEDVLEAAQ